MTAFTNAFTKLSPAPAAAQPQSATKPIELSLGCFLPEGTPINQHLHRWVDKIKADSKGRLTIRIYPSETLTSAMGCYPDVIKGVCDIGASIPKRGGEIGETIAMFMAGAPDAATAKRILDDAYNQFEAYRAEWRQTKFLWHAFDLSQGRTIDHHRVQNLRARNLEYLGSD